MPLARYFILVGSVLLALLFVSDSYLTKAPMAADTPAFVSHVRIASTQKLPDRIVYDTSLPTIVPVQTAAIVPAPAQPKAEVVAVPAQAAALNAFAKLSANDVKKPEEKALPKRKAVKRYASPRPVVVAQQPRFDFFANNLW